MEIVNPGGTGSPILPISDRLAPLPPKIFLGLLIFLTSLELKLKINLFIGIFDQLKIYKIFEGFTEET